MIRALALLGSLLVAASCGYHVAGRADTVPKTVRTIYVPAWSNNTVQYRLTDVLPEQIAREFIARSRYVIVNKIEDADAVLTGSVVTLRGLSHRLRSGDRTRRRRTDYGDPIHQAD
jgi:hypothetical protein